MSKRYILIEVNERPAVNLTAAEVLDAVSDLGVDVWKVIIEGKNGETYSWLEA